MHVAEFETGIRGLGKRAGEDLGGALMRATEAVGRDRFVICHKLSTDPIILPVRIAQLVVRFAGVGDPDSSAEFTVHPTDFELYDRAYAFGAGKAYVPFHCENWQHVVFYLIPARVSSTKADAAAELAAHKREWWDGRDNLSREGPQSPARP